MKKTKTKTRPKPAAQKLASSTSLALTKVARTIESSIRDLEKRLPTTVATEILPPEPRGRPAEEEVVLVEYTPTKEEEAILAEPVPIAEVRIKPDGAVYLSHPSYTRWFNRAFGRLGWAVEPHRMKPEKAGSFVMLPYVFRVHGKPVLFAWGEQEYFESNRGQSFGDAIESTQASALRRFAKRMGVSLELWEKEFGDEFKRSHCIRVKVKKPGDDKAKNQWRRKIDSPLPWEMGRSSDTEDDDREPGPPPASSSRSSAPPRNEPPAKHANENDLITQPQRQRLVTIIHNSGRDETAVAAWLKRKYKINSLKDITRRNYDPICSAIESPADLPE